MKTILYTKGCMLLIAVLLASCNNYLKEDSGDLLIPEKVDEFQAVLYGEGYPHDIADDVAFIDLMTDDVTCMDGVSDDPNGGYDQNSIPTGRGAYLWAYDVEYYITDAGDIYNNCYKSILACNTVIEHENTMEGLEEERNFCVAQAYALRAYNYFYLVNLYGLPYNKATASTDMGVAIRLSSEVTREQFVRSSVQAVYDQIYSDLERALYLFQHGKESTNKYLMSENATLLLLSRVALFTEDWDKAIQYGEELYNKGFKLEDLSSLTAEDMSQYDGYNFMSTNNAETIFRFGGEGAVLVTQTHKYMYTFANAFNGPMFTISQEEPNDLWNIYEEGDNRKYAFFRQDYIDEMFGIIFDEIRYLHVANKYNGEASDTNDLQRFAFRYSEMLLNLAEAYVQEGGSYIDDAINMLNELRIARFATDSYVALTAADFATDEELLEFVRAERRRELCFEESHRWMDLRRYGMPRIEHKFHATPGAPDQIYVLEQGDQNYTLALPYSETSYNMEIEEYPRRDIQPQ